MAGIVPGMSNRALLMSFLVALAAIAVVNRNLFGIGNIVNGTATMKAA